MLDIKFIRENPEKIQKSAKDKGIEVDVKHVLEIDNKFKDLSLQVQSLREERNANSSSIKGKPTEAQIKNGQEIKEKIEKLEPSLRAVEEDARYGPYAAAEGQAWAYVEPGCLLYAEQYLG